MTAVIFQLPQWFTSPDDKPTLELFDFWVNKIGNTPGAILGGETPDVPGSETIYVQAGIKDAGISIAMSYNIIKLGNVYYDITGVKIIQEANGSDYQVFEFTAKIDLYLSFLLDRFSEIAAVNKTFPETVFFKQKHLNRFTYNGTTDTTGWYGIIPQYQQYLLNIHPSLAEVGKRNTKFIQLPTTDNNADSWYYTVYYGNAKQFLDGTTTTTIPVNVNIADNGGNIKYDLTVTGISNGVDNTTDTWDYFYSTLPDSSIVGQTPAYEILILKVNNALYNAFGDVGLTLNNDGINPLIPYAYFNLQQPYPIANSCTFTLTQTSDSSNSSSGVSTSTTYSIGDGSTNTTLPPNFLYQVASDYYIGAYALPLPTQYWIPKYTQTTVEDGVLKGSPNSALVSLSPFIEMTAGIGYRFNGELTINNYPTANPTVSEVLQYIVDNYTGDMYFPINCPTLFSGTNTFYTIMNIAPQSIPDNAEGGDYSNIEPALLNWYSVNVRMFGQDSLVRLTDFNYKYLNFLSTANSTNSISYTTAMQCMVWYLSHMCLTISPPNIMITNIPYNDFTTQLGYLFSSNTNSAPYVYGELQIPNPWNLNSYSDAVYSIIVKAEVPTPSTAWTNYIANNKNNYDMGLNISYLLAEKSQAEIQVARNNMGSAIASEIGGVGGIIGDIFEGKWGAIGSGIAGLATGAISIANASIDANTIAPENYDIQEDKYQYEVGGKEGDMSRVTNMRTSSTSAINVLNNTAFSTVEEVPPAYEQIAVINYYALNGYILERWEPFYFWYNRTVCNFVRIAFGSNALYATISIAYKGQIDKFLNKGFRVWNLTSDTEANNFVDYTLVTVGNQPTTKNYHNKELNPNNNDEINYLIGYSTTPTATFKKGDTNGIKVSTSKTNNKNQSIQPNEDSTKN